MPYAFNLPTTSALLIQDYVRSDSHPSLVLAAVTRRNILQSVLKAYKDTPDSSKSGSLTGVLSALEDYIPYLLALDAGLSGKSVSGEEVDVVLERELEAAWRPTLAPAVAGRTPKRAVGRGLDYEICFALTTLAFTHTLLARAQLHPLYSTSTPSAEARTRYITTANKHLLQANSVHAFAAAKASDSQAVNQVADVSVSCQSGLAALAMAEATLLGILKDDPYPAAVIQSRNKDDREWMYKAPDMGKVRAHLFARVAVQAAEYAGKANALLKGSVHDDLSKYVDNLQRTSKGKACRFLGIDSELGGEVGKGIAWLNGALRGLGYKVEEESNSKMKNISKKVKDWQDRKEDKKIEKGAEWGLDAGRIEESRVIYMLYEKWKKANDMMNMQLVPRSEDIIGGMPSGREMFSPKNYQPADIDHQSLEGMRAPVDSAALVRARAAAEEDSGDEAVDPSAPGAFPSSSRSEASTYY